METGRVRFPVGEPGQHPDVRQKEKKKNEKEPLDSLLDALEIAIRAEVRVVRLLGKVHHHKARIE